MGYQNIFILTLMGLWVLGTTLFTNLLSLPRESVTSMSNGKMIDFFIAAGFLALNLVNFANIISSRIIT